MLLFAVAVSIYCVAAVVVKAATDATLFAFIVALAPAIGYVMIGGAAIHLAEKIRRWSFPETYQPWNEELKFILGVIWPAVVVFWLTIGVFNHFATPHHPSAA